MRVHEKGSNATEETPNALGAEQRKVTLTIDTVTAKHPLTVAQMQEVLQAVEYVGLHTLALGLYNAAMLGKVQEAEQRKAVMHFFETCFELRQV
jgi:hypothetical protein